MVYSWTCSFKGHAGIHTHAPLHICDANGIHRQDCARNVTAIGRGLEIEKFVKGYRNIYFERETARFKLERKVHPLRFIAIKQIYKAAQGIVFSTEDASRAAARDIESHEEEALPKDTCSSKDLARQSARGNPPPTKIPTKLAPLKKLENIDGTRKKETTNQGKHSKPEDAKIGNPLATNRTARDYTNLTFQDPRFYECPELLESTESTTTAPKQEIDFNEVLKRSESMSPRNEKDWEQLSSKFSSEENIIDIDKLSISTLARSDKPDDFDKEKHPTQFGQQKELTLNGGGTMFLKSNRSRDSTPCHEGGKLEDFKIAMIADETCNAAGDKLKSILREKQSEDGKRTKHYAVTVSHKLSKFVLDFVPFFFVADDRHVDEERKSVRFDIEREVDIKFTYSGSEGDWESESEDQNVVRVSTKDDAWLPSSRKTDNHSLNDKTGEVLERKLDDSSRSPSLEKIKASKTNPKIVGKRFIVQNVSENEHCNRFVSQSVPEKESRIPTASDSLSREDSLDCTPINKFNKVKNIDILSKSLTDCSDSGIRRKNVSSLRFARNEQTDDETSESSIGNRQVYEALQKRCIEVDTKEEGRGNYDDAKIRLSREHRKDIGTLKRDFDDLLEKTRKELEENFVEQKEQLEKNLNDRLAELKREMADKVRTRYSCFRVSSTN